MEARLGAGESAHGAEENDRDAGGDSPPPRPGDDELEREEAWPDETANAGSPAETGEPGDGLIEAHGEGPAEPDPRPPTDELPALEELVAQIPAAARELLDDLFRARFTAVRRVPETALKRGDAGGAN